MLICVSGRCLWSALYADLRVNFTCGTHARLCSSSRGWIHVFEEQLNQNYCHIMCTNVTRHTQNDSRRPPGKSVPTGGVSDLPGHSMCEYRPFSPAEACGGFKFRMPTCDNVFFLSERTKGRVYWSPASIPLSRCLTVLGTEARGRPQFGRRCAPLVVWFRAHGANWIWDEKHPWLNECRWYDAHKSLTVRKTLWQYLIRLKGMNASLCCRLESRFHGVSGEATAYIKMLYGLLWDAAGAVFLVVVSHIIYSFLKVVICVKNRNAHGKLALGNSLFNVSLTALLSFF